MAAQPLERRRGEVFLNDIVYGGGGPTLLFVRGIIKMVSRLIGFR